ncbi:hypothetical protein FCV25MIE_34839 [Fagus crenata]
MAQSKIRMPLQFFPNQNPPSVNHKLGTGLTISLNERGIRCVSRSYKEEDCARAQWVPRVNVSSNKFVEPIRPNLVGSSYCTYEIGEGSGSSMFGPHEGPEGLVGLGSDLNDLKHLSVKPIAQPTTLNWVSSQPDKIRPTKVDSILTCIDSVSSEKRMRSESSHAALVKGTTWFL